MKRPAPVVLPHQDPAYVEAAEAAEVAELAYLNAQLAEHRRGARLAKLEIDLAQRTHAAERPLREAWRTRRTKAGVHDALARLQGMELLEAEMRVARERLRTAEEQPRVNVGPLFDAWTKADDRKQAAFRAATERYREARYGAV